jgi:hypothetical protein
MILKQTTVNAPRRLTENGREVVYVSRLRSAGRRRMRSPKPWTILEGIDGFDTNNDTHESEADNFIQRLTAAGGVLEVEGGYSHRAANDALIRDVMKSALRPKGYKLEITSVGSWQSPKYEARWARHFPDDVDERPVPIPDSVGKYHPVAKAFRDGTKGVSKEHVARAAKLLHALATDGTARG